MNVTWARPAWWPKSMHNGLSAITLQSSDVCINSRIPAAQRIVYVVASRTVATSYGWQGVICAEIERQCPTTRFGYCTAGMVYSFLMSHILVCRGRVHAIYYRDCFLRVRRPICQLQNLHIFQQDNARAHPARVTTELLTRNNNRVFPWTTLSPDLPSIGRSSWPRK